MGKGTILIADDDAAIRMVLNQALSRAGYHVRALSSTAALWQRVANGEGDLVITDIMMPDENAFDLLPRLKKARPEMPVIVMSAQNTFMTAIKAAQAGAYDYLPKPFDLGELIALVDRAMGELFNKAAPVEAEGGDGMLLVGRSVAMQDVYRIMARMMQTDLTVMITGGSGTGKGLVARALHDYGQRCKGAFVTVNMASTPQDRIETELFGFEKGTFGGVPVRSGGRFEQAHGGTLFLDEIGDMPLAAQTQLLRLLQNGNDTIAGRMPVKADVRIIAAANKNLRQLIDQGRFREDLYYRLNIVPLRLPPLRERCEDIADLVRYFFRIICKDGQPLKHVTAEGLALLQGYPWPGNVRELENLMQRIAALYPQEEIDASVIEAELKSDMRDDTAQGADSPFLSSDITIAQAVELNMPRYFASFGEDLPPRGLYHRILAEIEYPLVLACLTATHGNQIKAADVLGLNRNTLRKKIRDLGINIYRGA